MPSSVLKWLMHRTALDGSLLCRVTDCASTQQAEFEQFFLSAESEVRHRHILMAKPVPQPHTYGVRYTPGGGLNSIWTYGTVPHSPIHLGKLRQKLFSFNCPSHGL